MLSNFELNVLNIIQWRGEMKCIDLVRFFEIDKSNMYKILKKLEHTKYISSTNEKIKIYYSLKNENN